MRRIVGCLSLVLIFAACSSSHGTSAPTTTSSSTPVTPTAGLRGTRVQKFECPPSPVSAVAKPAPIGVPRALRLCPLGLPGQPSSEVTVAADRPAFAKLVAALARPDEHPTGGACAAYADFPQVVLAQTRDAVYQVSIPTDECGHYQRPALDALNAARR